MLANILVESATSVLHQRPVASPHKCHRQSPLMCPLGDRKHGTAGFPRRHIGTLLPQTTTVPRAIDKEVCKCKLWSQWVFKVLQYIKLNMASTLSIFFFNSKVLTGCTLCYPDLMYMIKCIHIWMHLFVLLLPLIVMKYYLKCILLLLRRPTTVLILILVVVVVVVVVFSFGSKPFS